jgi:hypothetical protein
MQKFCVNTLCINLGENKIARKEEEEEEEEKLSSSFARVPLTTRRPPVRQPLLDVLQ